MEIDLLERQMLYFLQVLSQKKALYLNLEGRPQFTKAVISKPGLAVDSWKVFKALDQKLSSVIKFNNYEELLKSHVY